MAASPDNTTNETLTPRGWVLTMLGSMVLVILVNLVVAWRADLFGVLRDAHGRSLRTGPHERKAKYLLNEHYVPENFDALVIGDSTSLNWKMQNLTGYRFYNDSLLGADGVEEQKMVGEALRTGHFRVALVSISNHLTILPDLQEGLNEVTPHEALGSVYSYAMLLDHVVRPRSRYLPDGSRVLLEKVPDPIDYVHPFPEVQVNQQALAAYRGLVEELVRKGVRVVYFVAPHYGLGAGGARESLARSDRAMLAQLPPGPVINMNADEFGWLHDDSANFIDTDHLSAAGADRVTRLVNLQMHEALQDR